MQPASLRTYPLAAIILVLACGTAPDGPQRFVAMTFNTGTSEGAVARGQDHSGYGPEQAAFSDAHYGNGLAWSAAVEDVRRFLAESAPDVVVFQELFHSDECEVIPLEARQGFVCERWTTGDPTVARLILGAGYQIACHFQKPDKCAAVKTSFGRFRGCDSDFCLDGLDAFPVSGCGGGSRIGRGVVELASGGELTVVSVHGTSGFTANDQACRLAQMERIFIGVDGEEPAANGATNLVLGDFNTDPDRLAEGDPSARRLSEFVDDDGPFRLLTGASRWDSPSYLAFDIDHVLTDRLEGNCRSIGGDPEDPVVTNLAYFDHRPVVCELEFPSKAR